MVIGKKEEGKKGKRGEISSEQTIRYVVPILTFLIVLGFLGYLGFKGTSQEDLCKLSVLSRGTSPESASALIPLKCSTKKVCLTFGKGKCEESFAGYDDVEVVKLPNADDENSWNKAARIIEEVSAEEMYGCWQSMGEGKIDLFGSYAKSRGFNVVNPTCVICGRVAIDKDVKFDVIARVNVHEYMRKNKVPEGGKSYLQAFTDKGINTYPYVSKNIFQEKIKALEDKTIEEVSASGREIALVFMQIKAPGVGEAVGNLGKDALFTAGGAFMASGVRGFSSVLSFGGKIGIRSAPVILAGGAALAAFSGFNAYLGQVTAAGYCGALATTPEIKNSKELGGGDKGCSIVEAVPYDYRAINAMCEVIEGNP
jgi:hypothetical protein